MEASIYDNRPIQLTSPCCRSGKCASCIEDARWERLFQQKLADPHYYSRRQNLWSVSPLAECCSGADSADTWPTDRPC
jgi:hypothetical protein